ncbi:hypothetical protein PHYBOEH_004347 [Phytophthora boehmeriae]|uniref:Uncharacterized protein n=1 Tax=Phytophthora boehmeriae TaxID=109152 RepID=A0A8T1X9U8_9STRA|nr:hypothetical protein PHYBOEH_004347 [Phytophthora boehmeriae]
MPSMPDTPGCRYKSSCYNSPSTGTAISVDDWKKARCQEQCRINNANFRKRKRERELQAASEGQESGQSTNSQVKDSKTTTEEEKKARRREKCRVYQFNYWKKKRLHEERLVTSIIELKKELQRLNTATASVTQQQKQKPNSMQSINAFYFALQKNRHPPLAVVEKYRSTYGCTPALEELLDLQREEFDSVESLRLHWLWYRTQFKRFAFSIKACERLDTSRSTIIKITGTLRLGVYCDNQKRGSSYDTIVCPVLQQFEMETGEQAVSRITSEVGLVDGVIASQGQSDLDLALHTLHSLSEKFSNDYCYSKVD